MNIGKILTCMLDQWCSISNTKQKCEAFCLVQGGNEGMEIQARSLNSRLSGDGLRRRRELGEEAVRTL